MRKVSSITLSWISARAGNGLRLVEPGIFVGPGRRDNLVRGKPVASPPMIGVGSPVSRELGNLVARRHRVTNTAKRGLTPKAPPSGIIWC